MPIWKMNMTDKPEYRAWFKMKQRCLNPNYIAYRNYGGRGISVCEKWLLFINFYADMGDKPTSTHSLDRIDPNGNYEPSNCRWATFLEQQNNRRNTTFITYKDRTQSIRDWCRELGLKFGTTRGRYLLGWSPEEIFEIPKLKSKWTRKN